MSELLRWAGELLAQAGVGSPAADAEALLAHTLRVDRSEVRRRTVLGRSVPDEAAKEFAALVARRADREPLQHLTGVAPFRHLELAVGPGVFVPRPETEEVAQVAVDEANRVVAERAGDAAVVVDLCTGSGAIALAVATEVPAARVHAVELDREAHEWAERNIDSLSTGERVVRLVKGDARTALYGLDGTADVVVSNPPYVPSDAVPVDPEVAEHDPAVALYGLGPDGLEVPRGITGAAARLLRPGGLYVMEHAEVQAQAARAMVSAVVDTDGLAAFDEPETRTDLTGRPRMVVARRSAAVHERGTTGVPDRERLFRVSVPVHPVLDATDPQTWGPAIDEAVNAISRGDLVVLPTDTVYGIAADAFDKDAVAALLAAKGRGRQMPPPVLVGDVATLDGLATDVPDDARKLVEAFWPGGFTVILRAQPSLQWDLGETGGTVALRMPDHPAALALLKRTGPLAVSSANRSGSPAAQDVADAARQLGDSVATYLDGGDAPGGVASTIVDATGPTPRIVREGAVSLEELREVVDVDGPGALPQDDPGEPPAGTSEDDE